MSLRLALPLALLLTTPAVAQTLQRFDLFPGTTSFSSRGSLRLDAGEVLQGVHTSSFRGALDVRGVSRIAQLRVVTQDQNCATPESFDFVVRRGTDATGPDGSTAGIIGEILGLNLPASQANGPCAWILTATPSTPIRVPGAAHWSFGLRLSAAANWVQDGQSVHCATADGTPNAHHAHDRAEDQGWQIAAGATTASHPSGKRSWNASVFVADGAVMNLRSGGRSGYGGTYPIASTASAPLSWDARIDGGPRNAGNATLVAIGIVNSLNIPIGVGANLFVPGPYLLFGGPRADSSGVAIVPMVPFVPASVAGAGTFHVQGVIGNANRLMLTNAQSITP